MRILVIGGSSFVGRAIVQEAIDRGHEVTLFNRGKTDPGAFPTAEHLTGDRNGDLAALRGREWDATVDVCAYVPAQVRSLLDALGAGAGHYTFISTISVYDYQKAGAGFGEDGPLLEPAWDEQMTPEKYGNLKVACEQLAHEIAGDRLLVVRPGFVLGPHDPTHRFTYWVERVAEGRAPIAGPNADQPLQGVDARDLGAFTMSQIDKQVVDVFHVTSPDPPLPFETALQQIASGVGAQLPEVRWIGPKAELPLTVPPSHYAILQAGLAKARQAGLSERPMADTARDTLEWVQGERAAARYPEHLGVGPTPEKEQELLAR